MSDHEETGARDEGREVIPGRAVLLLMRAGGFAFAVRDEECECVTPWAEPAPLPYAPAAVLGVASVRGRMRTVLDPVSLFEASSPKRERSETTRALLISLRGDEQLALAVESAERLASPAHEEPPTHDAPALPARATFKHDGETVCLLDPARLFDAAMSGTERRRQRAVKREP